MPEWTTMNELVTGDLVTEADMAALRGNIGYLLDPNKACAIHNNGSYYTTTSSSFVDVDTDNLTITLETHGGPVLVCFVGNLFAVSTSYRARFDVAVDGTRYSGGPYGLVQTGDLGGAVDNARPVTFAVLVTGLAAGTHTFALQWCMPGTSASLISHSSYCPVVFSAIEL